MSQDRREFLKLFGAGCAIVPIIGGLPTLAAEARIIEPPKVELAPPSSFGAFSSQFGGATEGAIRPGQYGMVVIFDSPDGGRSIMMAKTFITHIEQHVRVARSQHGSALLAFPYGPSITWKLEGQCVADDKGQLMTMFEDL